ncbi:golgin subfamily A member 7-like [Oscarella lobularis]|uniref:golgin subfamily A member 7-like n=1 Tax=Oscarella lobularis TaxID=121494 RepID=UPI003313F965
MAAAVVTEASPSRNGRVAAKRIFIERDYTNGTSVKFQTAYPDELEGRVEEREFQRTITRINEIFDDAEQVGLRSCMEGTLACATFFSIHLCRKTHYEKCLDRVAEYLKEQNRTIYRDRGVRFIDPMERGLRVIEIVFDPSLV